jgi:hypothetical protein
VVERERAKRRASWTKLRATLPFPHHSLDVPGYTAAKPTER